MNTGIAITTGCDVERGEFAVITPDNGIVFCTVNSATRKDVLDVANAINQGHDQQPVFVNVATSAGKPSEDITK